jgi:hypothetical protein
MSKNLQLGSMRSMRSMRGGLVETKWARFVDDSESPGHKTLPGCRVQTTFKVQRFCRSLAQCCPTHILDTTADMHESVKLAI